MSASPFGHIHKATFLERSNRFTLLCSLNGEGVRAFLPNPGRMWELLLPGVTVSLERTPSPDRRLPYTAVAVDREGRPVIVDTLRTNRLAQHLLEANVVPGLEEAEIVRREVREGGSRFDFLLRRGEEEILLEVKSCTLFGQRIAMFPDAVTARGKRHIEELAGLHQRGRSGAVLFLVGCPHCEYFLPDYHTDLEFARAFLAARREVALIPLAIKVRDDLSLDPEVRLLRIPWAFLEREAGEGGCYLLILRVREPERVVIGKLGRMRFEQGYYLYIGSASRNLTQRMERHRRLRKTRFWHVDYLRNRAEYHLALAVRTQDDLECRIARAVAHLAEWEIPGFGSSDCSCPSHLYGMKDHPLKSPKFLSLLQYFRMDRLLEEGGPMAGRGGEHGDFLDGVPALADDANDRRLQWRR